MCGGFSLRNVIVTTNSTLLIASPSFYKLHMKRNKTLVAKETKKRN